MSQLNKPMFSVLFMLKFIYKLLSDGRFNECWIFGQHVIKQIAGRSSKKMDIRFSSKEQYYLFVGEIKKNEFFYRCGGDPETDANIMIYNAKFVDIVACRFMEIFKNTAFNLLPRELVAIILTYVVSDIKLKLRLWFGNRPECDFDIDTIGWNGKTYCVIPTFRTRINLIDVLTHIHCKKFFNIACDYREYNGKIRVLCWNCLSRINGKECNKKRVKLRNNGYTCLNDFCTNVTCDDNMTHGIQAQMKLARWNNNPKKQTRKHGKSTKIYHPGFTYI